MTIEFKHGPVTITVTGLPECVPADAFRLALSIHSPVLLAERERVAGFSEAFTALGGVETFAGTDPAAPFSVVSADGDARAGFLSEMRLYPPGCSDDLALASSAIVTALDVDRHARDVCAEIAAATEERAKGQRGAAQQVAGVLHGIGERVGWTVCEATAEEARRLATMVDLKIADIRAVDADAYGGFVADAAIRSVAHKTGEDWQTVRRAWTDANPQRGIAWRFPANSLGLSEAGRLVARPLVAIMGRTVFDLEPCEELRP